MYFDYVIFLILTLIFQFNFWFISTKFTYKVGITNKVFGTHYISVFSLLNFSIFFLIQIFFQPFS